MARGINKVIVVGNLGQDPELRYTGSGTAVANMRVAVNESYKDSDGNLVDKTEWINVVAWARLAEICGEYLKKGSQVYFEGSIQTRSYENKKGDTVWVTEVKAREMMMLGGGKGAPTSDDDNDGQYEEDEPPKKSTKKSTTTKKSYKEASKSDTFEPDDDLPF